MGERFVVLFVCTANVCRSAWAESALNAQMNSGRLSGLVSATSAGTHAEPGDPMCAQGRARLGAGVAATTATALTAEVLRGADLVLPLDRGHRAVCARLLPSSRPRTFTLRQAAALSDALRPSLSAGVLPDGSPPLPVDTVERLRWFVGELDASRGLLAGFDDEGVDVVDRHGPAPHGEVFDEIDVAVAALVDGLVAVTQIPPGP